MRECGGDWQRLRDVCVKHGAVVVLHGASGLPRTLVQVRGPLRNTLVHVWPWSSILMWGGVVESGGDAKVGGIVLGIGGDEVFSVLSFLYGVRAEETDGMRWHCSFRCGVRMWDRSYSCVVYMAVEKDRAS